MPIKPSKDTRQERDAAWERAFLRTWLPRALSPAEYAESRELSLVLLKELYANVWLRGPEAVLWEARRNLLMRRLDQCAARQLPQPERFEFHRRVNITFGATAKYHQHMLDGFMKRYDRMLLPSTWSIVTISKMVHHPYWLARETLDLEHDPQFTDKPYYPSVINRYIYQTTLGRWLLAEMAVTSRHAARLHDTQEHFWAWLAATDNPDI